MNVQCNSMCCSLMHIVFNTNKINTLIQKDICSVKNEHIHIHNNNNPKKALAVLSFSTVMTFGNSRTKTSTQMKLLSILSHSNKFLI